MRNNAIEYIAFSCDSAFLYIWGDGWGKKHKRRYLVQTSMQLIFYIQNVLSTILVIPSTHIYICMINTKKNKKQYKEGTKT